MTKSKQQKNAILTIVCLLALAVFGAAMVWLHYQQLCSPGGGDDPYTSDLGQHLYFAQQGMIYSTVSLLIGPAYDIAGQDKADPQSMRSAIYAAIDIVEHRRAWAEWSRNPLQRAEREKGGRDVSVKDLPQTEKED